MRISPKKSREKRPRNFTGTPSLPIATAVLQGLPPGRGRKASPLPGISCRTISIRASPKQMIIITPMRSGGIAAYVKPNINTKC
jgi:hypothetical protein